MQEAEIGYSTVGIRPIVGEQNLLLPLFLNRPEEAGISLLARASVAHAAAHLLYSTPSQEAAKLKPMGIAVVSAIEDARVEHLLIKRLPGVRRWFSQAMQDEVDDQGFLPIRLPDCHMDC